MVQQRSVEQPIARMTYAEFLVFEEASETKHEFINGDVYAMAGGTPEHSRLASAMTVALGVALAGRRRVVLTSDARIRIAATGASTYPDLSVVCGAIERAADDRNGITNPTILVEVLSDSTESYDRGAKASHYRRISSLQEYVLVSQHEPLIEVYRRNDRGRFEVAVEARAGEQVELLGCGDPITLDVDAIYRDPLA